MRTTTPCYFSISSGSVSPTYDILNLGPLVIFLLANINFRCARINIMPEFTPNSWMLENHADKGNEPWKIFAWCVRDAMSKYSGIEKLDEKLDFNDKRAFDKLMNGYVDRAEINGQFFEYNGDEPVQTVKLSSRSLIRRLSTVRHISLENEIEKKHSLVQVDSEEDGEGSQRIESSSLTPVSSYRQMEPEGSQGQLIQENDPNQIIINNAPNVPIDQL